MVIQFKKPNAGPLAMPIVGTLLKGSYKKVTLLPGHNEVDKEAWMKVRELTQVKVYIQKGWIVEKGDFQVEVKPSGKEGVPSVKVATVKDFKTFPASEAEKIVGETSSLKTLRKWLKTDTRESVRIAIKERIEVVENYDAKKKKEEQNDDPRKNLD